MRKLQSRYGLAIGGGARRAAYPASGVRRDRRSRARYRLAFLIAVGWSVPSTGCAQPKKHERMQNLQQLIRGQTSDGAWRYVLTPMTSRVIPASAIVARPSAYADIDALIEALLRLPPDTVVYVADPNWFGPPLDRLAAVTPQEVRTIVARLEGAQIRIEPLGPRPQ